MKIRKIEKADSQKYLSLLLKLDKEDNKLDTQVYGIENRVEMQENYMNFINKTNSILLVVEDSKELVGYASIERDDMNRKITGFLYVGLLEKYTNKGIGTKLIESAIEWSKANNIYTVYLIVMKDNQKAISLFKRMGFIIESAFPEELKATESEYDVLLMSKCLKKYRVS